MGCLVLCLILVLPAAALGSTGGPGDDTLIGTGHADELRGGRGDDRIAGRAGGDTIRGGRGFDVCIVDQYDDVRGCEVMLGAGVLLTCEEAGECLVTGDEWGEVWCQIGTECSQEGST